MKSDVYKRKVVTPDELLARVLDAALRIKEREGQLRRTTRDIRTRVLNWTEFDGGIFENCELQQICRFLCKRYVIETLRLN